MKVQIFAAAVALTLGCPARAEFQVAGAGTQSAGADQAGPIRLNPDQARPPPPRLQARPVKVFTGVRGFGRQVPLTFAIQQIVPTQVRVVLGDGVNPDDLVDWNGGPAWIEALRAAVRPLNLHVTVTPMTVTISRA